MSEHLCAVNPNRSPRLFLAHGSHRTSGTQLALINGGSGPAPSLLGTARALPVLFTSDFPPERKTGETSFKRCVKLGIDEGMLRSVVLVTNHSANIINELDLYARINCSAFVLNTVLCNAFDNGYLTQELLELLELQKMNAAVTF